MPRFVKKPVEIEAIQFKGWQNAEEICRWAPPAIFVPAGYEHHLRRENEHDRSNGHVLESARPFLIIVTLEGDMRADERDWIIRGVQGEFYPCKPDIFEQTYEAV